MVIFYFDASTQIFCELCSVGRAIRVGRPSLEYQFAFSWCQTTSCECVRQLGNGTQMGCLGPLPNSISSSWRKTPSTNLYTLSKSQLCNTITDNCSHSTRWTTCPSPCRIHCRPSAPMCKTALPSLTQKLPYMILFLAINTQLHHFWGFLELILFYITRFGLCRTIVHCTIRLLSCKYEPLTHENGLNHNHDGSSTERDVPKQSSHVRV